MALKKLGLKETKEGLSLVYAIINATGGTLEDGRVTLIDLPRWFPVSSKVGPAVDNFKQIWPELKDMEKAEAEGLIAWTQSELDIPQDSVEKWIELAIGVLIRLVELYSMQLMAKQIKSRASAPKIRAVAKEPKLLMAAVAKEISSKELPDAKESPKEAEKKESVVSKAYKKVTKKSTSGKKRK